MCDRVFSATRRRELIGAALVIGLATVAFDRTEELSKKKIMKITHDASPQTLTCVATNTSPAFWSVRSEGILQHDSPPVSSPRTFDAPLIYAVDDLPCLTELYAALLGATGFRVRTFNGRGAALAALKADHEKPDLLITDYRGNSMPVDRFMQECVMIHPSLRILMASGFSEADSRFSALRHDRFLQKPFTPEQLQEEVRAALAV
jgi:CheY-like chemotaxis protein